MSIKKVIVATAVVVAAAAVYVGVAAAATQLGTVQPGDTVTLSGNLTWGCGGSCSNSETVKAYLFSGLDCQSNNWAFSVSNQHRSSNGNFSFNVQVPTTPGDYSYKVVDRNSNHTSSHYVCFDVTVSRTPSPSTSTAAPAYVPPPPPSIFLCYSKDQDQPGVWPKDVAEQLVTQGYWLPYAISGDASGGTNLGGFHLACNPASTQSVSDSFVGGDGTELGPAYAGATIGLYPKIGG